jgi:hypothetical protein
MAPITYRLMTINKVPERAKRLVGRVTDILSKSQEYNIEHVTNCESKTGSIQPPYLFPICQLSLPNPLLLHRTAIAEVEPKATEYHPDIVVSRPFPLPRLFILQTSMC